MPTFSKTLILAFGGAICSGGLALAQSCTPPATCAANQVSRWNGSSFECTSIKSIVVQETCNSGACSVQCPDGTVVSGGGWNTYFAENVDYNGPSGNGWGVADPSWKNDGHGGTTVYAVCISF